MERVRPSSLARPGGGGASKLSLVWSYVVDVNLRDVENVKEMLPLGLHVRPTTVDETTSCVVPTDTLTPAGARR